jgi:hypothetical protein
MVNESSFTPATISGLQFGITGRILNDLTIVREGTCASRIFDNSVVSDTLRTHGPGARVIGSDARGSAPDEPRSDHEGVGPNGGVKFGKPGLHYETNPVVICDVYKE